MAKRDVKTFCLQCSAQKTDFAEFFSLEFSNIWMVCRGLYEDRMNGRTNKPGKHLIGRDKQPSAQFNSKIYIKLARLLARAAARDHLCAETESELGDRPAGENTENE